LLALATVLAACSPARVPCDAGDAGTRCIDAAPDAPPTAWHLGPPLPRPALDPGVVLFGQKVVVAGGVDSIAADATARIDAFDIASATWQTLPDAPVAWTRPNLAVVGPTLYLAGGLEGAARVPRGQTYRLDPSDHRWYPLAAMEPGTERVGAGVVAAPGRIYLLGGESSTEVLASWLEYDLTTDRWTRLSPDLPVARTRPAVMRRSDGTLIVAGGFASLDGSQPLGDVWLLPPPGAVPRVWQERMAMRPPADPDLHGGCASGVVLGQLVCAGGQAGVTASGLVDSYEPYTNEWTVREPMPVARSGTQGAAAGGRLFIPGGAEPTGEPSDTLYIFSPLDTAQ
jgi:hypothetical protein